MVKWCVIYSSVTGNTKAIAESIARATNADIFAVKEAPTDLSAYDVVAVGYWLRRGAPDAATAQFLPQLKDVEVVLFQTHGAELYSEHAVTAFARAANLLGENCRVLGTFSSQGKINPALIEKRKNAPADDPHGGAAALKRWESAANHPDAADFARAEEFVAAMERKLALRCRYEQKIQEGKI